jgi:hypothetical protein
LGQSGSSASVGGWSRSIRSRSGILGAEPSSFSRHLGAVLQSGSATAFIILVSNQLGDWQKVEYYEARDRKAKDDDYVLLPIIVADKSKGPAANLPGLAQLHWIETTEPTAPEPLSRIVAALSSKEVPKPPEPWCIINPYRGLLALEEQDADFFFGRDPETAGVLDAVFSKPGRLIALIGNSGVGQIVAGAGWRYRKPQAPALARQRLGMACNAQGQSNGRAIQDRAWARTTAPPLPLHRPRRGTLFTCAQGSDQVFFTANRSWPKPSAARYDEQPAL